MTSRKSRSSGNDWASRLEPERAEYETRLSRAIGRPAAVECDWERDELLVHVASLHPAHEGTIVDELATLWPGFLAPAGVSLRIVDGDLWDNEAMALRCFELRRGA